MMALLQYRGLRRRRGKAKATGRAKGDELRRVASEPQWSMGLEPIFRLVDFSLPAGCVPDGASWGVSFYDVKVALHVLRCR